MGNTPVERGGLIGPQASSVSHGQRAERCTTTHKDALSPLGSQSLLSSDVTIRDAVLASLAQKDLANWCDVMTILDNHGLADRWRCLREFKFAR